MSTVVGRIKSAFRKGPRPQRQLPPGSYPANSGPGQTLGTITKPPYPTDIDDDDSDGEEAYNVREQTQLRGQNRGTTQSNNNSQGLNTYGNDSTLPPAPSNPSNTQFRGVSSGFVPGLSLNNNNNTNNNTNRSPNMNTGTTPNLSSQKVLPFLSQIQDPSARSGLNPASTSTNNSQPPFSGSPPGINSNPSAQPPPNNPQSSTGGSPPGMNSNQTQAPSESVQSSATKVFPRTNANQTSPPRGTSNQQLSLFGLLQGTNPQPSSSRSNLPMNNSNNLMNAEQGPSMQRMPSFRNQSNDDDNVSRLELDYPIENVLIDSNIPSAIAIKINEAVEQDRLGNAYHIHRYTFEPSTPQQITLGNNQHLTRHLMDNPYHGGTRHIREIHNNHQNSLFNGMAHPGRSNNHNQRQRRRYSEASLNDYIEQLLLPPGSTVTQAQNSNDMQRIFGQHLPHNQIIPVQSSIDPFQSNANTFAEPIFYYTARALPHDPMRNY